ncbi:hypothetical protein GGE45_005287 [Rhizobium aethiopicum]|uniref:Uncharacterized protein n=1 Tax=Rhizobium aethiopicum TaxID=1138170 RepID=A0A7W6MIB4_9HYPH|nr:hypothetical protein IE4803_PB00034 [Rhizobium etli bv. phaseoli str. IE4803]ARO26643.1 hypothetical protein TAL182_PC00028 [Rhizobium sp. TAL182]MBB4193223.1 hypothetical protein [Rhizobium aethiopicum]MBB4582925.1 hypothetical protein [Rhizobium aethiopicum]
MVLHVELETDDVRLPSNCRSHAQLLTTLLNFQYLGAARIDCVANQTTGLAQDCIQIVGAKRKFPEVGEDFLALE